MLFGLIYVCQDAWVLQALDLVEKQLASTEASEMKAGAMEMFLRVPSNLLTLSSSEALLQPSPFSPQGFGSWLHL